MRYNYRDSFGFSLGRAAGVMKNRFHNLVRDFDITPDQTVSLLRLSETRGVSPTVLAESIAKDKPTTVRIIEKLQIKGLIQKEACEGDKRSYVVYLSAKGADLQAKLIPVAEKLTEEALKDFTPAETELIKTLLQRVHGNLL